jgi:hypothetical protein
VVALLIMALDESLSADSVIEKLRRLRGPGAVQTVKVSGSLYVSIHQHRIFPVYCSNII